MFAKIKNRHLKIAIIVAPLLAIVGWGLAEMFDRINNPQRHDIRGEHSLCVPIKKPCAFTSGDLKLSLSAKPAQGQNRYLLRLQSVDLLEKVLISISAYGQINNPSSLQSQNGLTWTTTMTLPHRDRTAQLILRMVVVRKGHPFVSERPIRF